MRGSEREWPHLSIIIVNFNGKKWLKNLFESVLASDYPEDKLEIVFVDNNSSDKSVEYVKRRFVNNNRIKIVALDKNYGFTEGNNIGSKYIRKEARYIIFLNPDTQVDENWLKGLVSAMESDGTIGMAQSLLLDYYNRQLVQCAGLYMIDFSGWTWALSRDSDYDTFVNTFSHPFEIFAAMGAAMIIRRDLFFRGGGFDSEFFMFSDEADLAWRVWLMGYRVILFPKSIVYHAIGGSKETKGEFNNKFAEKHRNKNVTRMLIKNYDTQKIFFYLPVAIALMGTRAVYYVLFKKRVSPIIGFTQAMIWNIVNLPSTLTRRRYIQDVIKKDTKNLKCIMGKRLPLSEIIVRMK